MSNINVAGVPCAPMTTGKVFYVDLSRGSDSSKGTNASYPLKTIPAALALCSSGRGDIIVVSGQGSVSESIRITKDAVSIVSLSGNDSPCGGYTRLSTTATVLGIFVIDANKVRIEGIRLTVPGGGRGVNIRDESGASYQCVLRKLGISLGGASAVGINVEGVLSNSLIEDVSVVSANATGTYGILADGSGSLGGSYENIIRNCYMQGPMVSGITLTESYKDVVHGVKVIGATASINVTGTTSMVTECRSDVAISGTALAGDNTTVA
jgi:hypothetical protein